MMGLVQQKNTKETEKEKFMIHASWRKYTAHTWSCHKGVKGRVCAESRQDLGHRPLLGTMSGEHRGSQAKARLVN